jgi:predicted permease
MTLPTAPLLEVIPVGYLALSGVSAGIAWGLGKCFGLSKIRRNLAVAGATFMNSNTLPIALMQTMSSSLSLKWKADDTRAKVSWFSPQTNVNSIGITLLYALLLDAVI